MEGGDYTVGAAMKQNLSLTSIFTAYTQACSLCPHITCFNRLLCWLNVWKMHVQYVNEYECMHVCFCVERTCSSFWGESQVFVSPHCIFHFSAHQCKCQYSLTSCPRTHTTTHSDTNDMQLTCVHTHEHKYSNAYILCSVLVCNMLTSALYIYKNTFLVFTCHYDFPFMSVIVFIPLPLSF